VKIVELLLKIDGIDISSKNMCGETPLGRAAEQGHSEIVTLLQNHEFKKATERQDVWLCLQGFSGKRRDNRNVHRSICGLKRKNDFD
jgi:ankyrin repeat protein